MAGYRADLVQQLLRFANIYKAACDDLGARNHFARVGVDGHDNRDKSVLRQMLAVAQNNLGHMYYEGLGVEVDYKKAFELYTLAAEGGNATAQTAIGWMYYLGLGTDKDDEKSAKWTLEAAKQGDVTAMNNLGYLYENGIGIEKNQEEAEKWYNLAAKQQS